MNRAAKDYFQKRKFFILNSTIKCTNCNALFPLEYFECTHCEVNSLRVKNDFEFSGR